MGIDRQARTWMFEVDLLEVDFFRPQGALKSDNRELPSLRSDQ